VVNSDFPSSPCPDDPAFSPRRGARPLAGAQATEDELEARTSLQLFERIERLARRKGCDTSDIFRAAIDRYLEAEEHPFRADRESGS